MYVYFKRMSQLLLSKRDNALEFYFNRISKARMIKECESDRNCYGTSVSNVKVITIMEKCVLRVGSDTFDILRVD